MRWNTCASKMEMLEFFRETGVPAECGRKGILEDAGGRGTFALLAYQRQSQRVCRGEARTGQGDVVLAECMISCYMFSVVTINLGCGAEQFAVGIWTY